MVVVGATFKEHTKATNVLLKNSTCGRRVLLISSTLLGFDVS